ncbi:hypothetical protein BZA05DRAFT_392239 [Tricharina praecox]|uniref:uncharacterized protein n=1 Tax=Tricharina praecox TaxID=43433 RepID=UPI002220D8C7|nr:uncharacterized protein BZA05DRAFT_392239 [Tricharina praecox]KAI5854679.1 hypothetical protein BZA05DRAFT_392239 [Tricharina praecox]
MITCGITRRTSVRHVLLFLLHSASYGHSSSRVQVSIFANLDTSIPPHCQWPPSALCTAYSFSCFTLDTLSSLTPSPLHLLSPSPLPFFPRNRYNYIHLKYIQSKKLKLKFKKKKNSPPQCPSQKTKIRSNPKK